MIENTSGKIRRRNICQLVLQIIRFISKWNETDMQIGDKQVETIFNNEREGV